MNSCPGDPDTLQDVPASHPQSAEPGMGCLVLLGLRGPLCSVQAAASGCSVKESIAQKGKRPDALRREEPCPLGTGSTLHELFWDLCDLGVQSSPHECFNAYC